MLNDINYHVWNYWIISVPVVLSGAPPGAYVISYLNRDVILWFLVFIIFLDFCSTLILVPIIDHLFFTLTVTTLIVLNIILSVVVRRTLYRHAPD